MGGGGGGIFSGWYSSIHGPRLKRKQFAYERAAARQNLRRLERAMDLHQDETQRGGAILKQSLAARGLGKSSISDQDTARFQKMRGYQLADLQGAYHVARRYWKYMRNRHRYERRSQYAQWLDTVVNTAVSAYSMGAFSTGSGGQPQMHAEVQPQSSGQWGGEVWGQ